MKGKLIAPIPLAGMTGATAANRWVGATTAGPPTSGTFAVGDFVIAQDGALWVCTVAGTPGTWVILSTVLSTTLSGFASAAASNAGQVALATDVQGGTLYRSNGSSWVQIAHAVGSVVTAKGDLVSATAANAPARLAVGTAGQLIMPSSGATTGLAWTTVPNVPSIMPTGALAETLPRWAVTSSTLTANVSGTLRMVAIWLPINLVVTSVNVMTGGTALASGTHSWGALYSGNASPALLRQSTDVTSPVAGVSAVVTFTLSSTYTTTVAGWHYIGFMWAASTMPTLSGTAGRTAVNTLAPILTGTSSTGQTATAPNPAATLAVVGDIPYAYVS